MEPASLTIGVVGLAGLFSTCMQCFDYVQLGRAFGDDYGKCLLRLEAEPEDSHIHAVIIVSDTGEGMSEDFVNNHAFTAFRQENSLSSETGLGLSII